MTVTITKYNTNLHFLTEANAIYLSSENFLMKDDILIVQDGRNNPEKTFQVTDIIESNSKAIKSGYSIANLQLKN